MTQRLEVALAYLKSGLCLLPADLADKRPAIASWKPYQQRRPTEEELRNWFSSDRPLCLVAGKISDNLEMIDFDCAGEKFAWWKQLVDLKAPGLFDSLVLERSPSGGWHVVYRHACEVFGNLKLAERAVIVPGEQEVEFYGKKYKPRRVGEHWEVWLTLIETRGEGGIFLCDPSPGYVLQQGRFESLPVLSEEQRFILLDAAWSLNELKRQPEPDPSPDARCESGLRPGDDFNNCGDVRAVLRKHGWTLVRGGDNEYWRRPGKSNGTSATLKDRVFYVFSSSAAPFEPNQAYSAFRVYALLEHGGDYSASASELRAAGFGEDTRGHLSLISSEVDPPEARDPPVKDPGTIPDHLFHIPGFVEEVMEFSLRSAPYPNIALAFCGAIALQSFLAGRKVCTPGDLRTNIYLLALASSGTGKDFPRKVNSHILLKSDLVQSMGDKFASGEGIQDALIRSPAILFQNDEMDGVLRQINTDRENRRESIPNVLLTLFTSANDSYPIRVKAGQKESVVVDQPHVVLYGTATPQHFYESLSKRMLTNGFFARLCVIDAGKRGAGQIAGSVRSVPESIIRIAKWWAEFQPGTGNLQSFHPEPHIVAFTPEATEATVNLQRLTEQEYDRAEEVGDEVARTAWSRTCENAQKLALIYACSVNHEQPQIDQAAISWATEFAMHQTRRQLYLATLYVAENQFHGECLKFLRALKKAGGIDQRQNILRSLHCKAADLDQIVATLLQRGDIIPVQLPTKTKPAIGYQLR